MTPMGRSRSAMGFSKTAINHAKKKATRAGRCTLPSQAERVRRSQSVQDLQDGKSGYKAYKAVKYTKKARNVYKKTKRVVKVKLPKATVVAKKQEE